MDGLNESQIRFVEAYLIEPNATKAAREAGYKQPHVQGARLLANVRVREAIDRARQERRERARLKADQIIFELEKLALPDIRELYDNLGRLKKLKDMTLEQAQMIQEPSMTEHGPKLKLYDRMKALDMLMRHHGLYAKDGANGTNGSGEGGTPDDPPTEIRGTLRTVVGRSPKGSPEGQM